MFAAFTLTTLVASLFVVAPATQAAPPSWWTEGTELLDQVDPMFGDENQVEADKCRVSAVLTVALGLEENPAAAASFTDIPAGCEGVAGAMVSAGIIMGEGNDGVTFGSDVQINRAVFATMLSRAFNLDEAYPDATLTSAAEAALADADWAKPAFAQVQAAGIYKQLRPADTINIYEITTAVSRAMNPGEPTDPTDPTNPTPGNGGDLEITISDNTPESRTVPGGVQNAHIATFELEAGSDDVLLSSIRFVKGGIADDDALDNIALFTEAGQRVSKAKAFRTSDDSANVNFLSGGFTVEAGESVDLLVFGEVGSVVANSALISDEFFIQIPSSADVASNASSTTVTNARSNTMRIGSADAAELALSDGSTSPNVNVGERAVEVYEFEMENNATDETDIIFYGITLEAEGSFDEEDDLMNYELHIDGELVASTEMGNDGFVSFLLDDEDGYVIEDGKTVDAVVKADIMSGASETIAFGIDSELDVLAADASFGTGAKITGNINLTGNLTNIEAGEITLVAIDAEQDEFTEDTEEFVLGTVRVTSNAGRNLELQEFRVDITETGSFANVSAMIDQVEVVTPFGTYDLDLDASGVGSTETYEDDAIDILLPEGETFDMVVTVDIKSTIALDGETLEMSMPTIDGTTGSNFYVEELDDDEAVTDITPSSLSFNSVTGIDAALDIRALTQSDKTVVVGSDNVIAMNFELEASDTEDITVNDIEVEIASVVGPATNDNGTVSSLSLYMGDTDAANLLDSQSGSQLNGGKVEFDSLDAIIPAGDTVEFFVLVNVVNDDTLDGGQFAIQIEDIDAEDEGNDDVTTTNSSGADLADGDEEVSTRTITLAGTGTLEITNDPSDERADRNKHVLGGTTSDLVASYELTADNESILIEDLNVVVYSADGTSAGNAVDYISTVELIGDDGVTVLATENVTSDTVVFEDLDHVVSETQSENMYVRVKAHAIGDEKEGTQSLDFGATGDNLRFGLQVTQAEGVSSGDNLTVGVDGSGSDVEYPTSPNSRLLGVLAVRITDISLDLAEYDGYTVEDPLQNGRRTLAILKIDTQAFGAVPNTFAASSTQLQVLVENLAVTIDGDSDGMTGTTFDTLVLTRLDKGDETEYTVVPSATNYADGTVYALDLSGVDQGDLEITAGSSAYFAIEATGVSAVDGGYIQLSIEDLNTGGAGLVYNTDDSTGSVGVLRIGRNVERGIELNEPQN